MIPGGLTPIRFKPLTNDLRLDPPTMATGPPDSLDVDLGIGGDDRPAICERVGLGDARLLVDAHCQRPVGHRDGRDLHVLTDDDRAGSRVENHPRGHVRLDLQIADLRHEPRERDIARAEQFGRSAVDFDRPTWAEIARANRR